MTNITKDIFKPISLMNELQKQETILYNLKFETAFEALKQIRDLLSLVAQEEDKCSAPSLEIIRALRRCGELSKSLNLHLESLLSEKETLKRIYDETTTH